MIRGGWTRYEGGVANIHNHPFGNIFDIKQMWQDIVPIGFQVTLVGVPRKQISQKRVH